MKKVLYLLMAVGLFTFGSCASADDTDGRAEEVGESIDNAADEVKDEVKDAADEVEDEVD